MWFYASNCIHGNVTTREYVVTDLNVRHEFVAAKEEAKMIESRVSQYMLSKMSGFW